MLTNKEVTCKIVIFKRVRMMLHLLMLVKNNIYYSISFHDLYFNYYKMLKTVTKK